MIHYDLPDEDQIRRLFEFKLSDYAEQDLCNQEVIEASRGISHAEISLVCDDAIKESILYGTPITQFMIISLLNERHRIYQGREA